MRLFDARWVGAHGIGRFAAEVQRRLPDFLPAAISGRPTDPWDPILLHRYLKELAPALFFSPGYNPPIGSPCPFVFCVHDLNHLYVRDNSSVLKRAYYRHVVRPAIRRCRVLITGSEFSKKQICEWSGAASEHVAAVGYGVSGAFVREGSRHTESGPYFVCVGNEKSHKNWFRMLQAFSVSGVDQEYLLLLVGHESARLHREIDRLGLSTRIRYVRGVSDQDLADIYRGAVGLFFVSLYEGFGLPIIESMACGTPVLTSTATATVEVAGDAAVLVSPVDVEAIADGMRRLAEDTVLRSELRDRGFRRANMFSWDRTAAKISLAIRACA